MRTLPRSVGAAVFGSDATGYATGRLDYPPKFYSAIDTRIGGLAGKAIVEGGAGSGMATRALLARRPARLVAVEPDVDFAASLRAEDSPALSVVAAPFETAALAEASFDLAIAVSSLHWMDEVAALGTMYRALRPGGYVALGWNVYRAAGIRDSMAEAILPLLADMTLPPSETPGGHYGLDEGFVRGLLERANFVDVEHSVVRRARALTAEGYRALYASYSFVRVLDGDARARLLDAIGDLVERDFGGSAPNIVLTPLYTARRV